MPQLYIAGCAGSMLGPVMVLRVAYLVRSEVRAAQSARTNGKGRNLSYCLEQQSGKEPFILFKVKCLVWQKSPTSSHPFVRF
eukprot:16397075-Heterocapsa_arctica.AAC.2